MSEDSKDELVNGSGVSRRHFLSVSGAALAVAASARAAAQSARPAGQQVQSGDHHLPNEEQPGPNNNVLAGQNPDSVWAPETDNGTVDPFKYSFGLAHKEIDSGGWTRQVTVRDFPVSKSMAGVELRSFFGRFAGGVVVAAGDISGSGTMVVENAPVVLEEADTVDVVEDDDVAACVKPGGADCAATANDGAVTVGVVDCVAEDPDERGFATRSRENNWSIS